MLIDLDIKLMRQLLLITCKHIATQWDVTIFSHKWKLGFYCYFHHGTSFKNNLSLKGDSVPFATEE